jgi:hypothetical protein
MNAMNARQRFANRGYVILFNAVPDEFVDNIRSVARNDGLSWNNGTWDGEAFDTFRTRALFPDSLSRVITTSFRRHYMTFFPDTSATEWSVLRTAAGSRDSPIRRDFPVVEADIHAADLNAAPGVLLVATQDDTVLYGYGWNHLVAFRSNAETIVLNKGDMMLFRGDYIYSPAGNQTNSFLLHGYLDTPYYLREFEGEDANLVAVIEDRAVIDDLFCYVYDCPFVASGVNSLRKHLRRYHSFVFGRPRARTI